MTATYFQRPGLKFLLRLFLLIVLFLLLTTWGFGAHFSTASAQDGDPDPAFQSGSGFNHKISASLVLTDGKILVGGAFTGYDGQPQNRLARLTSGGLLDSTFNIGNGPDGFVGALALQPDGKILVGGAFANYNGVGQPNLVRLNADGTLDSSFTTGLGPNGAITGLKIQPDGKILIWGNFSRYNNVNRNRLARLNANGSLDFSFNNGTGFVNIAGRSVRVYSLVLQTDGKILVGGDWLRYNGTDVNNLVRLNADSTLDTSFTLTTFASNVRAVALQPDGKIVVGGVFPNEIDFTEKYLLRVNSDGTPDPTFTPGTGFDNYPALLLLQPDGKILAGGPFTQYNGSWQSALTRLNPNGTLDTTFALGSGLQNSVETLALQPDGKLIAGGFIFGYNGTARSQILRLHSDGTLDTGFGRAPTGANSNLDRIIPLPDGKILIGGAFTHYNGLTATGLAQLNRDGSLATAYNPGYPPNVAFSVNDILLQSNGQLLVAGGVVTDRLFYRGRVLRLNADLTPDPTFANALESNWQVQTLGLQSSGKIIAGGQFTNYASQAASYIVRLNADGTPDPTFLSNTGADNTITKLRVLPNDKILIAGFFTTYGDTPRGHLARLNADGTLDTTFAADVGFNDAVNDLLIQPDGKILLLGTFNSYNGVTRNGLARLNADGTLDTTFDPGLATNLFLTALALQPDGKILVAGDFAAYNGLPNVDVVRLNPDGTLDTSFNTGLGPNNIVYSLAVPNNREVLIGGTFSGVAAYPRNGLARLTITSKDAALLTLTSSANPARPADPVTFTASLAPITATGTLMFSFSTGGSVTATLVSGLATYVTSTLPLGSTVVTATYGGDANFISGSASLTQIIAVCNPLVVTLVTDDGTGATCGTFSHALTQATSGQTVTFALTQGSIITFTGSLSPTVPSGIILDGGASGVTLNGNGVAGDGLRLSGGNILLNLTIRRFAGRELVTLGGGNKLYRVRFES